MVSATLTVQSEESYPNTRLYLASTQGLPTLPLYQKMKLYVSGHTNGSRTNHINTKYYDIRAYDVLSYAILTYHRNDMSA